MAESHDISEVSKYEELVAEAVSDPDSLSGDRCREIRLYLDLTQVEAAAACNVSIGTLCRLEQGARQLPLHLRKKIARGLAKEFQRLAVGGSSPSHNGEGDGKTVSLRFTVPTGEASRVCAVVEALLNAAGKEG